MKKLNKLLTLVSLFLLFIFSITPVSSISTFEIQNQNTFTSNIDYYSNPRTIKNLAIFIEFSDSKDNVIHHLDDLESVANAYKIYNSNELFEMDTVNGVINVPSFKMYYERESYGNLSITTEIFPKLNGKVSSYQDSHPIGYYLKYNNTNTIGYQTTDEKNEREAELLNNAIAYVSNEISTSFTKEEIDSDDNGTIDAISFIIEGQENLPSSISWGDLLWSHKSENIAITETILGKKIKDYNLLYADDYTETASLFSLNRGTYGTIIHEFGHTLGYMDLYRYQEFDSRPVGFYDIMGNVVGSNPQSFLAYFTSEYNFSTNWHNPLPEIYQTTNNITLYKPNFIDKDEKRAIKIKLDNNSEEYFIVEYHNKTNTYESYSADSSGIIIYRVNEKNKYLGNVDGSNQGQNEHIYVFRPDETELGGSKGNLSMATFNLNRPTFGKSLTCNNNGFDNQTIFFSDGSNSGIQIVVTNETTDSVTFNVIFPEFNGEGTKENPYLIDNPNIFLQLMQLNTKNKYYKITENLDFSTISDYPIIKFEGNLDGNNKILSNIKTNGSGIFNSVGNYNNTTELKNLIFENVTIYSQRGDYLGGFAGITENVILNNIHLKSGTVTNEKSGLNDIVSTGGFIGNVSDNTIIENCSSNLAVSAPKNVGGFIGINQNAVIKNSFASGKVNGSSNIGGFIGLQAITGSYYHIPENVYYHMENEKLLGVGGYAESFHDLNLLDSDSLTKGISNINISPILEVLVNSKIKIPVIVTPNTDLKYNVIIENPNVLQYENNQLVAYNIGSSNIDIDIQIGTGKMRLSSNIIVKKIDDVITEEIVLQSLGLTKKGDYVIGFSLGTNVSEIRDKISSSSIILKSFKNSFNKEINDGLISTGMNFTLHFNNQDYKYTVVVKGDVNGDGRIYATDYVKVKNHIMGKTNLTYAYLLAADINNDGNIYATDYVQIKNHIMGKSVIEQK